MKPCPRCGEPATGLHTPTDPGETYVKPCGHRVTASEANAMTDGAGPAPSPRARTDGGEEAESDRSGHPIGGIGHAAQYEKWTNDPVPLHGKTPDGSSLDHYADLGELADEAGGGDD